MLTRGEEEVEQEKEGGHLPLLRLPGQRLGEREFGPVDSFS